MLTSRKASSAVMFVAMAVTVLMTTLPDAQARSAQGLASMERLLASIRGGAESGAPLGDLRKGAAHPLEKRQTYDASCKGVYDRVIFAELEHVCDDCYNLYRNPIVATGCREECFGSGVFDFCVFELLLPNPDQILRMRDAINGQ